MVAMLSKVVPERDVYPRYGDIFKDVIARKVRLASRLCWDLLHEMHKLSGKCDWYGMYVQTAKANLESIPAMSLEYLMANF